MFLFFFFSSELARQLQQEEERVAAEAEAAERDAATNQPRAAQSSRLPTQSPPSQPKKKDNVSWSISVLVCLSSTCLHLFFFIDIVYVFVISGTTDKRKIMYAMKS